jgi:hypothetical protein
VLQKKVTRLQKIVEFLKKGENKAYNRNCPTTKLILLKCVNLSATKKQTNTLRIGFQNIGGFSTAPNRMKDDTIRSGISTYEFDIFGLAETNVDWRLSREEEKLYAHTKEWWEHLHLSFSFNTTTAPLKHQQFGGTAIFSINKASHWVIGKGQDESKLGRWCWTRYRGKQDHTLRKITAYRPNPPGGPFTVYTQHQHHFNTINDGRCPRIAFLQDLCTDIETFKEEGDHIVLLIDGNSNMRCSDLKEKLTTCHLREVLLQKHGPHGPSTYRRNNQRIPIDGIWTSPNITISAGGYFAYDEVFLNTDHRCLWIDITYIQAFGHTMPAIVKPSARRLHCRDPRIVNNFTRLYESFILKHNLIQHTEHLANQMKHPPTQHQQKEYNTIDNLHCQGVRHAERRCRKLRMGQVGFSPEIQQARQTIYVWSLLKKRSLNLKVSSRLLQRSLKKAKIHHNLRQMGQAFIDEHLHAAFKHYYSIKGSHPQLRQTHLENRAEALAAEGNKDKEIILKTLHHHERQRSTAKKYDIYVARCRLEAPLWLL